MIATVCLIASSHIFFAFEIAFHFFAKLSVFSLIFRHSFHALFGARVRPFLRIANQTFGRLYRIE